jgi:hypothetical protein
MPNGTIPTWEEWNNQLTEEQRAYSLYKILSSMDQRLTVLESNTKTLTWKRNVYTFVGSFMGGAATVGAALLARVVFWK